MLPWISAVAVLLCGMRAQAAPQGFDRFADRSFSALPEHGSVIARYTSIGVSSPSHVMVGFDAASGAWFTAVSQDNRAWGRTPEGEGFWLEPLDASTTDKPNREVRPQWVEWFLPNFALYDLVHEHDRCTSVETVGDSLVAAFEFPLGDRFIRDPESLYQRVTLTYHIDESGRIIEIGRSDRKRSTVPEYSQEPSLPGLPLVDRVTDATGRGGWELDRVWLYEEGRTERFEPESVQEFVQAHAPYAARGPYLPEGIAWGPPPSEGDVGLGDGHATETRPAAPVIGPHAPRERRSYRWWLVGAGVALLGAAGVLWRVRS